MLKKAVALSTLAVLASGDLTQKALASPDVANIPKPSASNYTVPVASPVKSSTAAIAPPEAVSRVEFSSSSQASNRTANTNNVVVTTTPPLAQTPLNSTTPAAKTTAQAPVNNTSPPTNRTTPPSNNDLAVTALDVQVTGASDELQQIAYKTIQTRA
ncbi:MAG: outer membrane protein assembly factor, partial [Coleofasciculaceae cyanobacterium]